MDEEQTVWITVGDRVTAQWFQPSCETMSNPCEGIFRYIHGEVVGIEPDVVRVKDIETGVERDVLPGQLVSHWQKIDSEHDQTAECARKGCHHPYYRHFDPYEGDVEVGCKYCRCPSFVEPEDAEAAPGVE